MTYIWGVDGHPWPSKRPEALSIVFGDQAVDLVPRIEALLAEAYEYPPDDDLACYGNRVKDAIRQRHPELDDEAVKAVGNLVTYSWR